MHRNLSWVVVYRFGTPSAFVVTRHSSEAAAERALKFRRSCWSTAHDWFTARPFRDVVAQELDDEYVLHPRALGQENA